MAAAVALGTAAVAVVFLREGSPSPVTPFYGEVGASSAQRVAVNFKQHELDQQLPRNAIAPIFFPPSVPARRVLLHDLSYVIGVEINGEAKAYPIQTLNLREMVNDTVGGVPVLVTW